jgi:glycosyltransferase involved in cell wall biosynthesis
MNTSAAFIPRPVPDALADREIAVLIPCFNEAAAIAGVIADFRKELPGATIYIYDNNSTDETAAIARKAGAEVRHEPRQGKGYVVRRMFADISADIYILVDGDATYEPAAARRMIAKIAHGGYDMVSGLRVHTDKAAYRAGHVTGNRVLTGLVKSFFSAKSQDMLSGYKAMSRRFVKSFPSTSSGFEIETELLIHAIELDVAMCEIPTVYTERPAGSVSKLSTFRDGFLILNMIAHLFRDLLPLRFFMILALVFAALAAFAGTPVIVEYLNTGLVPRLPSAVAATGLVLLSALAIFAGLILDSVAKGRREAKLLAFLSHPPAENRRRK